MVNWKKISKDSWRFTTPSGSKRYVKIEKLSAKAKKNLKPQGKYNYIVWFGTDNPKQFRQFLKTKTEALNLTSLKKKSLLFK